MAKSKTGDVIEHRSQQEHHHHSYTTPPSTENLIHIKFKSDIANVTAIQANKQKQTI